MGNNDCTKFQDFLSMQWPLMNRPAVGKNRLSLMCGPPCPTSLVYAHGLYEYAGHDERQIRNADLTQAIGRQGLTQEEAGRQMGISQAKVSGLMRGDLSRLSERKLMECLNRLGCDIEINVEPRGRFRWSPYSSSLNRDWGYRRPDGVHRD